MPEDVGAVINKLFDRWPGEAEPGRVRSFDRLGDGVVALDYGDDDHAFQVTVERVPRWRWRPDQAVRIGHVDDVDVALAGVTVDNFVRVELTAAPSDERDQLTRRYNDAFDQWAGTAKETQAPPPEQPAIRLMRITIKVSDDVGIVYKFSGGEFGGTGAEWEAKQSFRPRPPARIRELRFTFQAPDEPEISVPVRW